MGIIKSGIPVLGKISLIEDFFQKKIFEQLVVAIGYNHFEIRANFFERYQSKIPFATIIHPTAIIDSTSEIGEGSVLYAGCILDKNVKIGKNVLLNIGVMVSHDSVIGDHSFLAPRCNIAGFVKIGQENFIGIGVNVIDNVSIISRTYIGGGALVNRSIHEPGVFVGVPAKKIK